MIMARWLARATVPIFALGLAWVLAGPASAAEPVRAEDTFQFSGTIDCGTFNDNFTDFFTITEVTFSDTAGNVSRVVDHVDHTSNDVNSVTGLALHEHDRFMTILDPATGTFTVDGAVIRMNRPGQGIVIQDVGRLVFDADFHMIFVAGHHEALEQGDQAFCNALA
jgi:hypothetical protein